MLVLGIQGSPRKNGNSHYLLNRFLSECEKQGAQTQKILTDKLSIQPCRELIVCEKKGYCPLKDEMESRFYGLIKQADVVVLASPVFFYNVSAQAKIFIDRCQMFWGRKYKLGLKDPHGSDRKGVLLSVAASGGKRLFEGVELTAKYFFDAISAEFSESLTYKKVEAAGAVARVAGVEAAVKSAAQRVVSAIKDRQTLVFVSRKNTCFGPMAAAFAKTLSKGAVRILSAGLEKGPALDPAGEAFMAKQKLDLKYHLPKSLAEVMEEEFKERLPDRVICLGIDGDPVKGADTVHWMLDPDAAATVSGVEKAGHLIKNKVAGLF